MIKDKTRMVIFFLIMNCAVSAPTELGNGNDGADLVEFVEVKDGILQETREKAVEFLSKINLRGIQGLGFLKDEVEKTRLYISKDGLSAQELLNLGAFKEGSNPIVYARTFPRPHAPTRFFPAAKQLSKERLVSLHIHEGLHRALPASIRESEEAVEEITKVIKSPDSMFEDIVAVMDKHLPKKTSETQRNVSLKSEAEVQSRKGHFFSDNSFSYEAQSLSVSSASIWSTVAKLSVGTTLYKRDEWSVKFNTDFYSFRSDSTVLPDSTDMFNFTLRLEEQMDERQSWGVQVSINTLGGEGYLINPLTQQRLTTQFDYTKQFDSFELASRLYYTPASSVNANLETLQDPNLFYDPVFDEFSSSDRRVISAGSSFGEIYSVGVDLKKRWLQSLTTSLSLDVHKMQGYFSFTDSELTDRDKPSGERFISTDNSVSKLPFLAVMSAASNYRVGDFQLGAKYFFLVNKGNSEEIGAINLTTLGDPIGRGLGNSSLSFSASYLF
jgi:hypothetical protein